MDLKRCEKCLGKKEFVGLGMMLIKCDKCKGIGYISDSTKEPKIAIKKERKKRILKDEHIEKTSTEKA